MTMSSWRMGSTLRKTIGNRGGGGGEEAGGGRAARRE
jgi:hypothetical protein